MNKKDIYKTIAKTSLITIGVILGIFVLFIIFVFVINPATISNDYKLYKFKKGALANKYPNSTLIMEKSTMGLLGANSNHCDFLVQAIYATNDDFSNVQQYYNNINFNPVVKSEEPALKEIIDLSDTRLPMDKSRLANYNYSEINQLLFRLQYRTSSQYFPNSTIYLVNVFDQFYEGLGMWDIRCH